MSILSDLLDEGPYLWFLAIFGILCAYVFLAQKQILPFGLAIIRTTFSFFTSPLHYLRKTVSELAMGEANPRLLNVDHYLLKKMLISMQVALLIIFIVGCGLAAAGSYEALLPPRYMRVALSETQKELEKTRQEYQVNSQRLKQEDSDWANKRQDLINQARKDELQKKAQVEGQIRADEAAIASSPDAARALAAIKNYFAERQGYYGVVEQAKEFINRLPSLNQNDTSHLISFCDHWSELQALSSNRPKTEDEIRAEVQPDHVELAGLVESENSQIPSLQERVKALDEECSQNYHPGRMVLSFLSFFLMGILYTWGAGLIIEAFSLSIYLAGDVKQIRTQLESSPTNIEPIESMPAYR
jgi:hypothetical protein